MLQASLTFLNTVNEPDAAIVFVLFEMIALNQLQHFMVGSRVLGSLQFAIFLNKANVYKVLEIKSLFEQLKSRERGNIES